MDDLPGRAPASGGHRIGPAAPSKATGTFGVGRIWRAVGHSRRGLASAWREEAAFRQELLLMLLLAPLTLWLQLPRLDTVLLFALMALVLVTELLNSGLEAAVDKIAPGFDPLAAKAKDCGSAAVFVSLFGLAGAWIALAGPALWQRMLG